MTTITFDTHQFVQRLKASGLDELQAEAITDIVREASASANLATKHDLAETKADIIKWVAGMLIIQSAVIAALVKLL